MANFTQLQQRVARNVIDLPTNVQNAITTLINQAIRTLEQDHNFKCMEAKTAALVTTTETRTLAAVPSDFKEFRQKPYMITDLGTVKELGISDSVAQAEREYGSLDGGEAVESLLAGEPRIIALSEPTDDDDTSNFLIYPLPDGRSQYADGEYRIIVPYWRYLPDLASGSDSNWFTVNAERYIEFQATADAFFLDWDEERGTLWMQRAAAEANKAKSLDKRQRLSRTDNLPVSLDAHGPRAWRGDVG